MIVPSSYRFEFEIMLAIVPIIVLGIQQLNNKIETEVDLLKKEIVILEIPAINVRTDDPELMVRIKDKLKPLAFATAVAKCSNSKQDKECCPPVKPSEPGYYIQVLQ